MTREEEIEQQTFVYYETCSDEDIAKSKGFIDGAEWADQNPREGLWESKKVIDFIKQNWIWNESIIESLRKAMEG